MAAQSAESAPYATGPLPEVRFFEGEEALEARLHRRTARFVFSLAAQKVFPDRVLRGGHSAGHCYLYNFVDMEACTEADAALLEAEVNAMIAADLPIESVKLPWIEALTYFETHRQPCAALLIKTRTSATVTLNKCADMFRLDLHQLYPSLGALGKSKLNHICRVTVHDGTLVLVYDQHYVPQPGLYDSFKEHLEWATALKVPSLGAFNAFAVEDKGAKMRKELIMAAEFRQDAKLNEIATAIKKRGNIRVLAIAGPTSSGKTTFATKLAIHLANLGLQAKQLSVDHYYLGIKDQPKYKIRGLRSDIDYDDIESMDVKLVNEHIQAVLRGESILTPHYDFKSGERVGEGNQFHLPSKTSVLVIEGIHALNPQYLSGIDQSLIYRVYISPLTTNLIDDFNAVKTTDHRMLRRMTRDYNFRGYSASHTISKWSQVRRGEHHNIFPFQNNADYTMNSAADYEIPVLKTTVEPLLRAVRPDFPDYPIASSLLSLLDWYAAWEDQEVPLTALLREFIGNGAFDCH